MTPAQRHMARVAELPCCLCGDMPVHVHHIIEGRTPGRRSPDFLTLPVCPSCHIGPQGIHGDKTMLRVNKTNEHQLLNQTLERLYGSAA